ncbi:MAG: HAD family phosphatase [Candidatus Ancillula sp.]|jgi:epoxide hydrolase-like predicted phosphatase|nr:HAD family phosphatase [Candidatus Ancillula sp.]
MSIEAVIFDFGNVFTVWNPGNALSKRYTEAEIERFFEDTNWDELIKKWDAGALHFQIHAEIQEVDKKLGTDYASIYEYYTIRFNETISQLVAGMEEIVRDLQANGIKTLGLTNWAAEDIFVAKEVVQAISLMQGIVVSGIEKTTKPDPKIYEILLERYKLSADKCIFIDDKIENIQAAQKLGIIGFHFPDVNRSDEFRKFLEDRGVL